MPRMRGDACAPACEAYRTLPLPQHSCPMLWRPGISAVSPPTCASSVAEEYLPPFFFSAHITIDRVTSYAEGDHGLRNCGALGDTRLPRACRRGCARVTLPPPESNLARPS